MAVQNAKNITLKRGPTIAECKNSLPMVLQSNKRVQDLKIFGLKIHEPGGNCRHYKTGDTPMGFFELFRPSPLMPYETHWHPLQCPCENAPEFPTMITSTRLYVELPPMA